MSEVEKLKQEINYFSVLIQKHKQHTANTGIKTSSASKYKWSKDTRTMSSNATVYQNTSSNSLTSQSRKRPIPETNNVVRTKFSKHLAPTKAPVTFDPKFKWSKDKQTSTQLSVSPHSSSSTTVSSNVPCTAIAISTTANPSVSTASANQSKYKYHRSVPPNVIPTTSTSITVPHYSIYSDHKSNVSQKNEQTFSAYKFNKTKRPLRQNVVAPRTSNNPYKIRRMHQGSLTLDRKKMTSKYHVSRNARSPMEKRRRSIDTSTHITLSKAALERLLKKHSTTLKQSLANKAVVKSLETSRTKRRSVDRSRQHCLYYGRFGKCMRGDSCKFIHDPTKIAVCTRFLRGTCRDANCSFSHKVEKEKIPLCLFFIRGKCTVPGCPYLHVFLGKDAPVCKRFASTGFCPNADKCKEQHIKCCAEFFESGKCPKGASCHLPHFKMKKSSVKKAPSATDDSRREHVPAPSAKVTSRQAVLHSNDGEYLSLEVGAPAPINVPVRRGPTLIKPRFGKLKTRSLPQK